jgi:hypothetical protein
MDIGTLAVCEVEEALCRIPAVSAVRIVDDEIGRPIEVHVLATLEKHAKQIVLDIQSFAMATFWLDLDRRIISVVQLEGGPGDDAAVMASADAPTRNRVTIERIDLASHGVRTRVQVTLGQGGEVASAESEGSVATSAQPRLVAQATLEALRRLFPAADCADVEMATVVRAGNRDAALASVVFAVPPFEETVCGSAVVRDPGGAGVADAVARAVLDACNRRLPRLG